MKTSEFLRGNLRWLAAGMLLTFMSSFGQTFFISIFSGEIRDTFGLSHGDWGLIYSIGTGASAVVMVWAGGLADRFRTRLIGASVLLLLTMACLFMAFNPIAALLPVSVFLLRFAGQGMVSHVAMVSMSRWFVAARGRALSVATLGFTLGEALLPISFVFVLAFVDWHVLWMLAAGMSLLAVPVLVLLLRHERTPQSMAEETRALGMDDRHWRRSEMLRHPLFWFVVPALLGPSAFNTAFFFHQVHLAEIKGWTHLELVAWFPFYTAMSVAAMVSSGWVLDRIGTPRLMPWYQLPMVGAFLLLATAQSTAVMMFAFTFLALTTGFNATLANAFWAEFYGTRHLGEIKALAAAVMVLGSAIGPAITGVLIDLGIGLETQFLWVAGYFIFTTVMMAVGVFRARGRLSLAA